MNEKDACLGTCRRCGAEIRWIKTTKNRKWIPCNMNLWTLITSDGDAVTGYVAHFATCPIKEKGAKP